MEDLNNDINSSEKSKDDIIIKKDISKISSRCPKCYLIPSIRIYEEQNKLKLYFKCGNNHEFKDDFTSLYNQSKIDFDNITCKICSIKKLDKKFYICNECKNFFCNKCRIEHIEKNSNHLCLNLNKYDSRCKIHNKDLIGYCDEHQMNYCDYCPKNNHEFNRNKLIYDEEVNNYENIIKNYENKIIDNNKELDSFIKKIEEILTIIKNQIKATQTNQLIKIYFQKELIETYKYMKNQKNLNYQIIENVRNIMKLSIKIELNQNINNIIYKNSILLDNFINEIKYELGIIKKVVIDFKTFKFENMNSIKTLNDNKGDIYCLTILDDGRLAAGDSNSNLIIYDEETFKPDIIIKNNLNKLYNLIQLKNKYLACSFDGNSTFKIIKIKNKYEYEEIQIINKAHPSTFSKLIELKNDNIITCSYGFKLWKLNNKNNNYEQINETSGNFIYDCLETKDNEILYAINIYSFSLIFYNLNKNTKIQTLNNISLCGDTYGYRMAKINDNEIVLVGHNKIYLIDTGNYLILNEIIADNCNYCVLKLTNNLFLVGDDKGTISQYNIANKKLIKESWKNKSHENRIYSLSILNDKIISGSQNNEIKIWKK